MLACLTAMKSFWNAGSSAHCSSLRSSSRFLTQRIADLRGDEVGEARVGGLQPAARRDAVGLVVELAGIKCVEVGEEMLLEQLGVERRDAVDRVAADDGEIGHADHLHAALLDERHAALLLRIAGIGGLDGLEQALVDLENELQVARQDFLEKRDAPFFQRLRAAACGWCRRRSW